MTDIVLRILLSLLIVLVALGIGFLLRRLLVRRLKKTVLDNWLIQTLGILVIFPPLVIAVAASPIIIAWNINLINDIWAKITQILHIQNGSDLVQNLFWTVIIIALGIGTARTVMKLVIGRLGEQRIDINIRTLLGRIFFALIVTIVIFWILSLWNVSIGIPVAVLGGLTVAFTVAIQDILKDLVAGLYILWERPFHIGDQITTATYTGKVENVELRATKLRLLSGEEMTIPNSMVFGGIVVNNTQYYERRAKILLNMPQEEFKQDETPAQILKVVREQENVLVKPEPAVGVTNISGSFGGATGGSSGYTSGVVTRTLYFWIPNGQHFTITEVMCALHKALPNMDLTVAESGGDM